MPRRPAMPLPVRVVGLAGVIGLAGRAGSAIASVATALTMVTLAALPSLAVGGCQRSRAAPPGADQGRPPDALVSAAGSAPGSAVASTAASEKPASPVAIDVVLAGDAIPQVKVLANGIAEVLRGMPPCWAAADARVLNLEAPIGERKGLPGDRQVLAYAAPASWFGDLYAAAHASAFVVANNHACDLGPQGLAATVAEAEKISAPVAGAAANDPWKRIDLVERGGHHVCLVAWTTFLNDEGKKGKKQRGCIDGSSGARIARAELGKAGLEVVHQQLSAPERFQGCDARIAYLHGGREYQPQIRPVLEQATAAAAYVDAVIVSHPHVPDLVEVVSAPAPRTPEAAGGRPVGRGVPVYRSLGNFVSNQGIAWTSGMSVELLEVDGVPDPIRTVWTRVAMLARLRFGWEPAAAPGSRPSTVRYGYSLLFTDRSGPASIEIRLRPLPSGPADPVSARLRKASKPFGALLDSPCRLDGDAPPTCDGSKPGPASPSPPEPEPPGAAGSGKALDHDHPMPDP